MHEIQIEIPDETTRDYDNECIICFEDKTKNRKELVKNKYCDCNFLYHQKCYEKWLVYLKLTPPNRHRRLNEYRCILCRKYIDFKIDMEEWLEEGSEGFKELENMRDMTDVLRRNERRIYERRRQLRRELRRRRSGHCCLCEIIHDPWMLQVIICHNDFTSDYNDFKVSIFIIVFIFMITIAIFIVLTLTSPWIFK